MSEQEGPDSSSGLSLDKEFLRSLKGRILLAEMVLCFVLLICVAASMPFFLAIPLVELIATLIFVMIFSSHYHLRCAGLNWPCMDFMRCVSAVFIIVILAFGAASQKPADGGTIASAIFGFLLIGIFSYDAYNIYKIDIRGQAAETGHGADEPK